MRKAAALAMGLLGAFCALAQTPRAPYLYFRLNTPRGMQTLAPGRPAQVVSNKAIALEVCIRTTRVEDQFEQPQIRALNQHPEFFAHRPPPNIEIMLRHVLPNGPSGSAEAMPFRVNSSGGGKDLEVYFVNVDMDMLEEKSVRLQKAGQFVEWMLAQSPDDARSHLLETPAARQRLIEHFEDSYINNPPGDYEITAKYTPTTPENWRGTLVSAPVRLCVVNAGDFFEVIKAQQAGKAGAVK
ncbi:MAG TPA: hypothetical protein VNH83_00710 [Bryobacteraceae bacterium]|nr:hypothetical protein [Bryobacteraceae bacterium]